MLEGISLVRDLSDSEVYQTRACDKRNRKLSYEVYFILVTHNFDNNGYFDFLKYSNYNQKFFLKKKHVKTYTMVSI